MAVAVICVTAPFAAGAQSEPDTGCTDADMAPGQASMHSLRSSVLCLVNRMRRHRGLPLLGYNEDLRSSAEGHSDDMVANGYFSHFAPGGSTPLVRVERTGYMAGGTGCVVGENLGWGIGARRGSPLAVFRSWMHSPPHRANILNAGYRDFGVGVSRGSPYGRSGFAGTYTLDLGIKH